MRDLIALAILGMGLLLILWCALGWAPSRPGRHSAAYRAPEALPTLTGPRMTPWSTPTPAHVHARRVPLRGEDTALIRPYVLAADTVPLGVIRERRTAAVLATLGVDYAYEYAGSQFESLAARTSAGVTA
ncbi:hypothetical protein SLA_2160 [Streptomyces laurentii]|uniref:Uncharacterized protein n=1 Tax=Streptomyces laurentii TaxID=39478 RepID=A0A160NYU8_STRLU|nr:hypothetical protein SLA_2160 [Streptomyces laurentii]